MAAKEILCNFLRYPRANYNSCPQNHSHKSNIFNEFKVVVLDWWTKLNLAMLLLQNTKYEISSQR